MYGIENKHREAVVFQINKNLSYLEKRFVINRERCKKLSHSAHINPDKFYAEFQDIVNSLHKLCYDDQKLLPSFFTITAPAYYHNIENFKSYEDMIKKTLEYLSDEWRRFLRLKVFEHMKRDFGFRMPYYKIVEPHKSGVPHLHFVIYLPKAYVVRLRKISKLHFKGHTVWKVFFKRYGDGKHGILAYVSKYISKLVRSFELDDAGIWYRFFNVRFFTYSRTMFPTGVKRKIKWREEFASFYNTTVLFRCGRLFWDFDGQLLRYDLKHIFCKFKNKPKAKNPNSIMANSESWQKSRLAAPLVADKPKDYFKMPSDVIIDNDGFVHIRPVVVPVIPFVRLSDWELHQEYKKLLACISDAQFDLDRFMICDREYQGRGLTC
jgi:hypothetical protein